MTSPHRTITTLTLVLLTAGCQGSTSDEWSYYEGDLILSSQADFEDLCAHHNAIWNGELTIAYSDVEDLSGLDCLRLVDDLSIHDNDHLVDLAGLDALMEARGEVSLRTNESLVSLNGLQTLTRADALWVYDNPSLVTLQGLDALEELQGLHLGRVEDCGEFADPDCNDTGQRPVGNESLEILQGLPPHLVVTGDLDVVGHPLLVNLSGLEGVTPTSVRVYGNTGLQSLQGMQDVEELLGFEIAYNPKLADLEGLESLRRVTGVATVHHGDGMTSLEGLRGLEEANLLAVQDNRELVDLTALNECAIESLTVEGNDALRSLGPVRDLWLSQSLTLQDNESLQDLGDLRLPEALTGSLHLTGSEDLTSIDGFEDLAEVQGAVTIRHCDGLSDLGGLASLVSVGFDLSLEGNDTLQDLDDLAALRTVGALAVDDNASLVDVTGLHGIEAVDGGDWGGTLAITDNPVLPTLAAIAVVSAIGEENIAGGVTISGNQPLGPDQPGLP